MNGNEKRAITVEYSDESYAREDISLERITQAAEAAAENEGIESCEAYIILTDGDFVHELNKTYRNVDSSTDVLSFPENELELPLAEAIKDGFVPENDISGERIALGDIYISIPQAARQAEEYGNTLTEELRFLAVHGMLHLLGYDHMQEDEELVMREKQRKALGRK